MLNMYVPKLNLHLENRIPFKSLEGKIETLSERIKKLESRPSNLPSLKTIDDDVKFRVRMQSMKNELDFLRM